MSLTPQHDRLSARQRSILEFANNHRQVLVDPLAETFDVTPQTIRRDLNHLCEMQLLRRIHGGAIAPAGVANMGYRARQQVASEGKRRIGARCAQMIPNDASLFINLGTTTEQVAAHLVDHTSMLVITNNINVVTTLRDCEGIDLMTAGGRVRREDGGIVGTETEQFFSQFKVDFAVIGVSAIEPDGTLLEYDNREVNVTRAIIANARAVMLVADATKFKRSAPVRVAPIDALTWVVTDQQPQPEFAECCARNNVELEVVSAESTR